jgi:signal transduction histidine kinase
MSAKPSPNSGSDRITSYIIVILIVLLATLALVQLVMHPPSDDLVALAAYLGITSFGSAIFGFVSHRLGWWRRLPRLSYALILGYILAGGLTLFNVWITARLMFINQHDLALGSLLLLFAGGISVGFGYFLSSAITQALETLVSGAEQLSKGDFSARVPVSGQDEVARLAKSFNQMASQLEKATVAERDLEEARRNLVAWASHDLRTPLTSLRVMVDALVDGVADDPETVSRYLRQSQAEIARMSNLLDDLFELARLDAGNLDLDCEWINLSDLVSDTLESFTVRSKNHEIALTGFVSPQVDPIWAAPDKLSRILDNLLVNAFRHTLKGGHIQIHARVTEDQVLIEVEDDGLGITAGDLPHIFDRFYRGDQSRTRIEDKGAGSGLGLAIVKGLVEAHGGVIWVENQPKGGAKFAFTLPYPQKE